jgi:hypothetical protein
VPLADALEWLVKLYAKPKTANGKTDWATVETEDVRTGDRTNTLTRLAGHLFRKRVDPAVAFPLLLAWNLASCKPPLPLAKVEATIGGIWECEQARRARS